MKPPEGYDYLVLYFYPKDNTPGCTIEAKEFSELLDDFKKTGAWVVGVSPDSEESHKRFRERHDLRIELVSDSNKDLARRFGVLKTKKRFGREYLGIERSTFLIDKQGRVIKEWRNVKAKGHAKDVLEFLREMG